MKKLVDRNIEEGEECVRCLIAPFGIHLKNEKIRREAFLPQRGHDDVSHLRLRYTTLDFCLQHGTSVAKTGSFAGLAMITQRVVNHMNEWAASSDSATVIDGEKQPNGISAMLVGSPMHQGEYVDPKREVYTEDDVDLPMNADLKYQHNFDEDVKSRMRRYACELSKVVKYSMADKVNEEHWQQEDAYNQANAPE